MSMTLKLSHVAWDQPEGPHSWRYETSETATPSSLTSTVGYSGPARLLDTNAEALAADVGGEWVGAFMDDPNGPTVYFQGDPDSPYIWRLDDVHHALDTVTGSLTFESNPAHDVEAWLGDVRQVTALGDVLPDTKALKDAVNGNDPRFAHLCGPDRGIEHWTWMGPEKKTIRKVIMVGFDNGATRTMLVERAWLLGPNGDTIEKICP